MRNSFNVAAIAAPAADTGTLPANAEIQAKSVNVVWQPLQVNRLARARQKAQGSCVVWLTGLSGAGKSTLANAIDLALFQRGCHSYLLDGDNLRHGLSSDLGFEETDRIESIRRLGEAAKLLFDAGLIVVVASISPFRAAREQIRQTVPAGHFLEVYVDTPLALCEQRDPKGLYRRARRGEIAHFTGVDSPYEAPIKPELRIDTSSVAIGAAVEKVLRKLADSGIVAAAVRSTAGDGHRLDQH